MNESDILLRILEMHVGEDNAITRDRLLQSLELDHGVHIDDRELRAIILKLRNLGKLIVSHSKSRGYYMASNMAEYQLFEAEEKKRIKTMYDTVRIMRRSAIDKFGDSYQPGLI